MRRRFGTSPPHADAAAAHAAIAAGASLTRAHSVPPTRSSGSASSQRTAGGAVAREIARSNVSRIRPGARHPRRGRRDDVDGREPEQAGDVDEEAALAPVGVEEGHREVGPEDRDDQIPARRLPIRCR